MSDQQPTPFPCFPGGNASCPLSHADTEGEREVALAHLRHHHNAIQEALKPFQEAVEDLSHDWGTRGKPFWQRLLRALCPLRVALHAGLTWLNPPPLSGQLPLSMTAMRYQMTIPLGYAESQIDTVGIAVTAYLPVCSSRTHHHLQQRNAVFADVRELVKRVQKALDMIGPLSQEQCRQKQRHAQKERFRRASCEQRTQNPEEGEQ